MDKLEELKHYVTNELSEHKLTVYDFETPKAIDFCIKSEKIADLVGLVKCDNVHEASELASLYSDDKWSSVDYYEKRFTEQAKRNKIDPLKPVGIDIIVSVSFG